MTPPAIRRAHIADGATLSAIGRQSFVETFGHLYAPDDLAAFLDAHNEANWAAELADPAFHILIAEADGMAAGYAKLGPPRLPVSVREGAVELRQFYVLAPWHGTGLAHRMMDRVIARARAQRARDLILSVFVDNHRARAFYARYGFADVGRYAFMVGGHEDENRLMRLALDD